MSLSDHLQRLKEILDESDLEAFERLSRTLKALNGDISRLSDADRELIVSMEQKYGDSIRDTAVKHVDDVEQTESDDQSMAVDQLPLLKTEFADYVKNMLLRELGSEHKTLKSAVDYAYQTKWMPAELKNPDVCETLYERFFADIEAANEWREKMTGQPPTNKDKPLGVGLAWFMYIYQLRQWVDKYPS